jgi:hypothetical protein
MARKPRKPGPTEETIRDWVLGRYFDYIKDKNRAGGFLDEFQLYAASSAKFAPDIAAGDLLNELVRSYSAEIWHIDPSRRPSADDKATGPAEQFATADADARSSAPGADGEDEDEEDDLFSVAGVMMPPSFTFPDPNVPGGFRRVGRRWATIKHMEWDTWVKRKKADEAIAAADRAMDDNARVAAVARDPDELLWNYRDGPRGRTGSGSHDQPRA